MIRILIRSDTTAEWLRINPILALDELVFDTTKQDFKCGNGLFHFAQLNYLIGSKVVRSAAGGGGGGGLVEWTPGTYPAGLVVVLYNHTMYQLEAEDRPFESEDLELEVEYGLWQPICCDQQGEPLDPALYLLTEDGRRITDESGQPITIN